MRILTESNKFPASIEDLCLTIGLFYFKYLSGIFVFIEGKCLLCLNRYITLICQCKCLAYINGLSGLNLSCCLIQPGDPRKSRRWGSAGDWVTFAQQHIGKGVLP